MNQPLQILIIAGEESGDLHGSSLVHALKEVCPGASFYGLGGKKMRQAGVHTFFEIDRMGMVGLIEIFGNIFHYLKVYRTLAAEIASKKYSAAVLIDYPTLNLRLANLCKQVNCPVFYFISPQLWAWRRGRIDKIRRTVKKMLVFFPFEETLYRKAGVDAEFIGHPFIEQVRPTLPPEKTLKQLGLRPGVKTIGILPGSRKNEVEALLGVMMEAAAKIKEEIPDCQFLLPIADSFDPDYIHEKLSAALSIKAVSGNNYNVMNCCDFIITASGSATLEAGLLGCPMVIVYKLNFLTYWLARWLVKINLFGLVNIVAGEEVVPELIQDDATSDNIAREALRVLQDPQHNQTVRAKLSRIGETLGTPGVARRAAESIALHLLPEHEKADY